MVEHTDDFDQFRRGRTILKYPRVRVVGASVGYERYGAGEKARPFVLQHGDELWVPQPERENGNFRFNPPRNLVTKREIVRQIPGLILCGLRPGCACGQMPQPA